MSISSNSLSPIEKAAHQEFEYYGSTLTTNTALKACLLATVAALCFLANKVVDLSKEAVDRKPLIVRVSEVGKAEAIDLKYSDYTPQDAEVRYFLNSFITGFYGRNHATIQTTYPNSLAYLAGPKFAEIDAQDRKSKWAAKFLTSGDDNVEIEVQQIGLDKSQAPIYRAEIAYQKVFVSTGGSETKREHWTANLAFRIDPTIAAKSPELVRFNPLGFAIFSLQSDQAFQ